MTAETPLSGRPGEFPSTQDVQVQVIHALAGILPGVRHDSVALTVQAQLACNLSGKLKQSAEQPFSVGALGIAYRGDVTGGYHEHVHRCLRVDVAEREGIV